MPAKTNIQFRRDTAANWASANPVLAAGEMGFESDTNKFKVGNGTATWTSLNYFVDEANTPSGVTTINNQSADYTIQSSDAGNIIRVDSASAVNVTLPSDTLANIPVGGSVKILRSGTGTVSIIPEREVIGTSPSDASTWTSTIPNFSFGTSFGTIRAVAYGNGLWIIGGDYGQMRASTDTTTWTTVTSNFYNNQINTIAYANGIWLAGGRYQQSRLSTNGTIWTAVYTGSNSDINTIAYGNSLWIAAGTFGEMFSSTDGTSWNFVTSNFSSAIQSVAYGNGLWVAVGNGGAIRTSTDGSAWITVSSNMTFTINQVAYGNGTWVAAGYRSYLVSTNGSTWTSTSAGFNNVNTVTYGNGIWLLGGQYYGLRRSTDTITWTTVTSTRYLPGYGSFQAWRLAYGNGSFVFAGRFQNTMDVSLQVTNYNFFSTISSVNSRSSISGQHGIATAYKRSANTWLLSGDLA